MAVQQISPVTLQHEMAEAPAKYCLLDVREPFEYDIAHIESSVFIPMHTVADNLSKLDKSQPLVVICHHGMRSQQVAYFLDQQGFQQVFNLTGGIDAWSRSCDASIPLY